MRVCAYVCVCVCVRVRVCACVRASVWVCQFVCGWIHLPLGARQQGSVTPSTSLPATDLFMYVREMKNNSWHLRVDAPKCRSAYWD